MPRRELAGRLQIYPLGQATQITWNFVRGICGQPEAALRGVFLEIIGHRCAHSVSESERS